MTQDTNAEVLAQRLVRPFAVSGPDAAQAAALIRQQAQDIERLRLAVTAALVQFEYVLECINRDRIPFDGDEFHEAIELARAALKETK